MILADEILKLKETGESKDDFPDIDFRRDIAEELSRDDLIDRLCEMNKSYGEMREEWFNVTQLGNKPSDLPTDELRKELKLFNDWMCGKQYDGQIPLIETCIDDYLRDRLKNKDK